MKYWTLLTLRILARVGLSVTVIVWVAGQWGYTEVAIRPGSHRLLISTDVHFIQLVWLPNSLAKAWYDGWRTDIFLPAYESRASLLDSDVPPVWLMRLRGGRPTVFHIDHWLLCLTFLIATIATSVRWWKPAAEENQEPVDER